METNTGGMDVDGITGNLHNASSDTGNGSTFFFGQLEHEGNAFNSLQDSGEFETNQHPNI